jgi:uncharacterized protein (DUF2147 family)
LKKTFATTILFILIAFYAFSQNRAPENIIGIWSSEDEHIKVEIYKAGPQYFGKEIWGDSLYEADRTTPKKDIHNTDERLRRRNLTNLVILKNIDPDGGAAYGGIFYDYKTGKTYKSILKLRGSDVLKVRDYSVVSMFGKSTTFTRVQ